MSDHGGTVPLRPVGHWCDDACVCFLDGAALLWSGSLQIHACVNPGCPFAGGYETKLRATWEELRDCAEQMATVRRQLARLLGLPTDPLPTFEHSMGVLLEQYNALRQALGWACASYLSISDQHPILFIRDLRVGIATAEDVDGWERTAQYTRLANASSLTSTHSVSTVDDVNATPTKGTAMTEPNGETVEATEADAEAQETSDTETDGAADNSDDE